MNFILRTLDSSVGLPIFHKLSSPSVRSERFYELICNGEDDQIHRLFHLKDRPFPIKATKHTNGILELISRFSSIRRNGESLLRESRFPG